MATLLHKELYQFSSEEIVHRIRVVELAMGWIGTPYHHQASLRGVGTDCFGLIRGVWRELYGVNGDPERVPTYSWDWAEAKDDETMLSAARRHMIEVPLSGCRGGDVVLFRYRAGYNAKHAAILVGGGKMIHASFGATTCEVHMSDWWRRHMAGAFAFPLQIQG